MIRITPARPAVLACLSMSLFAAACGDPDRQTATFSTADDAHLRRSVDAIRAGDAGGLHVIGLFVSGEDRTGCPTIASTGSVTTVTGGCASDDGDRLDGTIVATNFPGHAAFDPSKPSIVEARDWRVTEDGQTESIDGTVSSTAIDGATANGRVIAATLATTLDGILVHTDLGFTCDASELCTVSDGSWVDITGVGSATVEGAFRYDDPRTGAITAVGAETLVIDIVESVDGCVVFRIDGGERRQVCDSLERSPGRALTPFADRGDARTARTLGF